MSRNTKVWAPNCNHWGYKGLDFHQLETYLELTTIVKKLKNVFYSSPFFYQCSYKCNEYLHPSTHQDEQLADATHCYKTPSQRSTPAQHLLISNKQTSENTATPNLHRWETTLASPDTSVPFPKVLHSAQQWLPLTPQSLAPALK